MELVKNLKERLRADPAATIASVSQNDCFGNCTCPKCRAVDEEEGGPAGSLLRFVNAVAADIEPEFPNIAIDTLAYQYTRKPPRLARPRPSVIVRLCSIECAFAKPLDDPRNKAFFDDLDGWSKIAGRLYIWDYTTNFSHYVQPHPNYGVLGRNIRLFVDRNVRGVFEQGAYQSWGSEMAELRAWVLAKLLWDPGLEEGRLREEFLKGYYGPAAGDMDDYLEGLEQALAKAETPWAAIAGRRQVPLLRHAGPRLEDPRLGPPQGQPLGRIRAPRREGQPAGRLCRARALGRPRG